MLEKKKIVILFMGYSAFELVQKTHEEDPWRNTNPNAVISKDSIKKYFER